MINLRDRKLLILTFDDGPSDEYTPRVLTALEKANARATFFMMGSKVAGREHLLRRMVHNGCEIGCHMWNHEFITGDPEVIRDSLGRTREAIRAASGVSPVLMRPPGGVSSPESLELVSQMNLGIICWNVDPRDWDTLDTASTVEHVLANAADGKIVIMHDIYEPTARAAEILIPELVSQGYELVSVSEAAAARGGITPGKISYAFYK